MRRACVDVDGETVSSIDTGMLVLVGVARGDTDEDVMYIANKVAHLRVFNDDDDARAACDFIINLLDLHKTSIPFEATVH